MPIVAAGVAPHSPLLLPTVNQDHPQLLERSTQAIKELGQFFVSRQPETLIVLTPHGPSVSGCVTAMIGTPLSGDVMEFGDRLTTVHIPGAAATAQALRNIAETENLSIMLQAGTSLDYGTTIPLCVMPEAARQWPTVPLTVAQVSLNDVLRLGRILNELGHQQRRLAILASADLSTHPLHGRATPDALERQIAQAITAGEPGELLAGDRVHSTMCGLWPIVALLATLQGQGARGTVLDFTVAVGVGLMTAQITIPL